MDTRTLLGNDLQLNNPIGVVLTKNDFVINNSDIINLLENMIVSRYPELQSMIEEKYKVISPYNYNQYAPNYSKDIWIPYVTRDLIFEQWNDTLEWITPKGKLPKRLAKRFKDK